MKPVPVALDRTAPTRFCHAIAALPRSFVRVEPGTAAIAVVLSGAPGWTDRAAAAVSHGALAVLVGDPVLEPVEQLLSRAGERGSHVVVAARGSHDPSLPALRGLAQAVDGGLLECRISLSRRLALQVPTIVTTLVRAVDSPIGAITNVGRTANGLRAVASLGSGRDALISVALTDAPRPMASLRVVGTTERIQGWIPLEDGMRPALVRVVDDAGERVMPSIFETSARAALRALHAALTDASRDGSLSDFAADSMTAALLAPGPRPFKEMTRAADAAHP